MENQCGKIEGDKASSDSMVKALDAPKVRGANVKQDQALENSKGL